MTTNNTQRTIVLYSMKGGSGTTVTAALTALHAPGDTLIVDLAGDMADVLGAHVASPTLDDFLADANVGALDDLVVHVDATTRLLPTSGRIDPDSASPDQGHALADWLDQQTGTVIVDAGSTIPHIDFVERADQTFAVTRPCYLSLIRAARSGFRPDGVIVVHEAGRAMRLSDIERALNAPIVATIDHDPNIARAVDAGLLVTHAHRHDGQLARITEPIQMASALDQWRTAKPGRHSPDIDYGMGWSSFGDPDRRWRVSWNIGSGDLYAVDTFDTEVIELAHYPTQTAAEHATSNWANLHRRPDGLDQLRTQLSIGGRGL